MGEILKSQSVSTPLRLGDVADVRWGDTSTTKKSYVDAGFTAYSATGPDGFLPYADYDRTAVVLSAIGADCGKTWLAQGRWSCIKNTIRFWSTDLGVDTEYLYWITQDSRIWPKRGSAQPFIAQTDARNLEIDVPPLPEQRRIAHILGTLDDKIELNRRVNETLEEMARAIFKDWFVDFGPVRAKTEGREAYLPEEIWRLFPDRLVESELGEVPEGWGVSTIDDLCVSVTSGGTPARKNSGFWDNGVIPWFKTGELLDSILQDSEEHITPLGLEKSSAKMWPVGTVLFALYASPTVGRLGVLSDPGTANQATAGLIPEPQVGTSFLKHTLIEARQPLQNIAVGAAQQNINQRVLKDHEVILPRNDCVRMFNLIIDQIHRKQLSNIKESEALTQQRDVLLPRLVSGEVTVGDSSCLHN